MRFTLLLLFTCSLMCMMIACDDTIETDASDTMAGVDDSNQNEAGESEAGESSMPMAGEEMAGEEMTGEEMAGMEGGEEMAGMMMAGEEMAGEEMGGMEDLVPPTPQCGDSTVINFQEQADGMRLNARLDEADNLSGSCGGEALGADVVIEFMPDTTGTYQFSVLAANYLPVIYALEDCNSGFTEIACDANLSGTSGSDISVNAVEGTPFYVVVDSWSGGGGELFTLTAELIQATPPTLTSASLYTNATYGGLGVVVEGMDAERDVVSYRFSFLDAEGSELTVLETTIDDEGLSDVVSFTWSADQFRYELTGFFDPALIANTASIDVTFKDDVGFETETVNVTPTPAVINERGEPCDLIFTDCGEEDSCTFDDNTGAGVCSEANPPTISAATAYVNTELGLIGLAIEGNDPENNVAAVRVNPLNEAGESINISNSENLTISTYEFDWVTSDEMSGDFSARFAVFALRLDLCIDDASNLYETCREEGRSENECALEANSFLEECSIMYVSEIHTVEFWVIDNTRKESEAQTAVVIPAVPVEVDAVCDSAGATAICPDSLYCYRQSNDIAPTCQEASSECGESIPTVALNEYENVENSYVYEGDHSTAENYQMGSCGGGGPQNVVSFIAPTTGEWEFSVTSDAEGVDLLMFAYEFCALAQSELACNDDVAMGNLNSGFTLELEAEQRITLFVDSYNGSFPGAFTLSATQRP